MKIYIVIFLFFCQSCNVFIKNAPGNSSTTLSSTNNNNNNGNTTDSDLTQALEQNDTQEIQRIINSATFTDTNKRKSILLSVLKPDILNNEEIIEKVLTKLIEQPDSHPSSSNINNVSIIYDMADKNGLSQEQQIELMNKYRVKITDDFENKSVIQKQIYLLIDKNIKNGPKRVAKLLFKLDKDILMNDVDFHYGKSILSFIQLNESFTSNKKQIILALKSESRLSDEAWNELLYEKGLITYYAKNREDFAYVKDKDSLNKIEELNQINITDDNIEEEAKKLVADIGLEKIIKFGMSALYSIKQNSLREAVYNEIVAEVLKQNKLNLIAELDINYINDFIYSATPLDPDLKHYGKDKDDFITYLKKNLSKENKQFILDLPEDNFLKQEFIK